MAGTMTDRLARRCKAAQTLTERAHEKHREMLDHRREVWRDCMNEGMTVAQIADIAGLTNMAVRLAIWPDTQGRSGSYKARKP